jgi:hypothetical protein
MRLASEFAGERLGHRESAGAKCDRFAARAVAGPVTGDSDARSAGSGFISSTLEELAEERAAARRAIRRLHLVPVWYEPGARPHPPRSMYRAYLEQSQIFVT